MWQNPRQTKNYQNVLRRQMRRHAFCHLMNDRNEFPITSSQCCRFRTHQCLMIVCLWSVPLHSFHNWQAEHKYNLLAHPTPQRLILLIRCDSKCGLFSSVGNQSAQRNFPLKLILARQFVCFPTVSPKYYLWLKMSQWDTPASLIDKVSAKHLLLNPAIFLNHGYKNHHVRAAFNILRCSLWEQLRWHGLFFCSCA